MLKTTLNELFSAIASLQRLYVPDPDGADVGDTHKPFKEWKTDANEKCDKVRTPKDFFFPQTENLVDFKREGKKIEIIDVREETEDFTVFGLRACDIKSFEILDRVFLSEPVDTYYKNRREHCTTIAIACNPDMMRETCFCQTFGINCAEPEGDVSAWIDGDNAYLEANTEKGRALVESIKDSLKESDDEEVWAIKTNIYKAKSELPLATLTTDGFTPEKMMEYFNSDKWADLSESCIGCGTCTFVCPTCQCYDIKDFDTGSGIKRFRCWDSCMYSDFTKMAHGNPRVSQLERFRQRFMHKLVYYPANNEGIFSCVGCGRCLSKCPISMNIVKVMKAFKEEK